MSRDGLAPPGCGPWPRRRRRMLTGRGVTSGCCLRTTPPDRPSSASSRPRDAKTVRPGRLRSAVARSTPPRLRAIAGGRPARDRTLVLDIQAFEDPTTAMRESVKALRDSGPMRAMSAAAARELLTDQRLQLIRVIRKGKPDSVAELARAVNRTAESVKADLDVLARLGVVVLEGKRVAAPAVPWDRIEIRVEV